MPREDAVRSMLANTLRFEELLHAFLGEDHPTPDRAPFPDATSLVSENGEFLVYRLIGSPPFLALKSSIATISEVASNVFANTPGKATFDWVTQAVHWIDSIAEAIKMHTSPFQGCNGKLGLLDDDARQLLQEGEAILLDVPEDLRKTLSEHKIFVSTNKDGKLKVKSKKGGAHYAVGVTAIRWCPLLFDALTSDVDRTATWIASVRQLSVDFVEFRRISTSKETQDESDALRYYQFRENLSDLLDDGIDLVVSPPASTVDSSVELLRGLDACILTVGSPKVAKKFAELTFKSDDTVVRSRFTLLDSLLKRLLLAGGLRVVAEGPKSTASFRQTGRDHFKMAMEKGISRLGIDPKSDDASALCATKACEIEADLYDLFQSKLGETVISPEYRKMARALKGSLSDPNNARFCASVVTGDVVSSDLVRMSDDQLANPKTKEERARAAALAKRSATLTPAKLTPDRAAEEKLVPSRQLDVTPDEAVVRDPIRMVARAQNSLLSSLGSRTFSGNTSLKAIVKTVRSNLPPPPPPSLAASILPAPSLKASASKLVSTTSGESRVSIAIANGSRRFMAGFYVEGNSLDVVSGYLPGNLNEKGRLRTSEFGKFLTAKMESGKWIVVKLRLVTFADKDSREYKRFYKEYEAKDRIAMFSVGDDDGKVFLVTPKFHHVYRELRFLNGTSTYAVVLKRR
jgi:Transcription factor S-II (TFIIS), central domain